MQIIDGKSLAAKMRADLKEKILKSGLEVGLAVVVVGEDPASQIYVRNKSKACEEVGIHSFTYRLKENCTQSELETLLSNLAMEEKIHGILLQLPLPKGLDTKSALLKIPVEKDVDGFSEKNMGRLLTNDPSALIACTPLGIMKMLENEGIEIAGKHAVIVGRSETVGKPMALLLLNANATITVCHSKTVGLEEFCKQADILVVAIGKPNFITSKMVKDGAVVIDVGINRNEIGKLCGDVDFEGVKDKVSYITPVPGGVGPMTITMLLWNTYQAAMKR